MADETIISLSKWGMVAVVLLSPLLGYLAHCALEKYCYMPYARRYCRKRGLQPVSWICAPFFYPSTRVTTEYSIVQVDCFDRDGQPLSVQLLVSIFGVARVVGTDPADGIANLTSFQAMR